MRIEDVFKIIDENMDECDAVGGVDEELISRAEEYLEVEFPESYKKLLRKYGQIDIGGMEICGLDGRRFPGSEQIDVCYITNEEREENDLEHNLIPILYGDEWRFFLDTDKIDGDDCPIIITDIGLEDEEIEYESFAEFLMKECVELILPEGEVDEDQLEAALDNMVRWIASPQELKKIPKKIQCEGVFQYMDMNYYIFKFKMSTFGKWMLGVSGGYEGNSLEPCGHTYSDMKEYDEDTAYDDCIAMIDRIVAYWKKKAEEYK